MKLSADPASADPAPVAPSGLVFAQTSGVALAPSRKVKGLPTRGTRGGPLTDAQARAAFVAACDRIATELQAKRDDKELSEEERPNAALCEDASNLYALANRLVEQADPPAAPRAR